jgi:hypothetical protein
MLVALTPRWGLGFLFPYAVKTYGDYCVSSNEAGQLIDALFSWRRPFSSVQILVYFRRITA